MADVNLDEAVIEDFLNDINGPVGELLAGLSAQVAAVAVATAPVMRGKNYWTERSNAVRPPGTLRASIYPKIGYDSRGKLYGGANALADPGIFMEHPAEQLHYPRHFLTTGLYSLVLN